MSLRSQARWFSRGHVCLAHRCVELVSQYWLFCPEHWKLVPALMKEEILSHFQAKRRRAFVAAVDAAVEAVDQAEKAAA